ncbi:MAG: glycosyltransferase family 1 protein [Methylacidiphilales bacterium]|nr:glycosyltransferase family 1 protein [Candidatus Methylacidiphilales bacterium]
MKILLVTETFPPDINGVAMTLSRLADELSARGHDLLVLRPGKPEAHSGTGKSWKETMVWGLRIPGYPEARIGLTSRWSLIRLLRRWKPDLAHIATEGPLGWMALRACEHERCPVISSFHTNFHEYTRHYKVSFLERLVEHYLCSFHNRTQANLAPDQGLIERLEKAGFRNNCYFGRGVDTVLFSPEKRDPALRGEWGVGEGDSVILHVSRVAAEKNIPFVLGTYRQFRAQYPGLKMVVVGDGPERRRLRKQYPEVIFTGMKMGEELARHYASADFFFFASETETFGNVITESLASGLVVLAYDYAAGRQFIRTGVNGFTVPLGDARDFQACAANLLSKRGGEYLAEVRAAARRTALQIPWSTTVDRYEAIVRSVLDLEPKPVCDTLDMAPAD